MGKHNHLKYGQIGTIKKQKKTFEIQTKNIQILNGPVFELSGFWMVGTLKNFEFQKFL